MEPIYNDKLISEKYQEHWGDTYMKDSIKSDIYSQELNILIDTSGKIISVNPYIFVVMGFKPEEVIGRNVMEFVHPDDIEMAVTALQKAGQDLPHVRIYLRILHKNQSNLLIEATGSPLMAENLQLSTISLTGRVLDLEKPLEDYLFGSDGLVNLIFENAVDGISVYEEVEENRNRKLLKCNARYADMAGRTLSELFSVDTILEFRRLIDVDPDTQRSYEEAFEKSGVYKGLFTWIRPDKKENIIEYTSVPIKFGGRILVIGIDRDITDRFREKENQLKLYDHINRQQNAILKISTSEDIIKGKSKNVFSIITETAASAIEINRVSIWHGRWDESSLTCIDLFDKTTGNHTFGHVFPKKDSPEFISTLSKFRMIDAGNALKDPRISELTTTYLKPNGIKSFLSAPIRYSGNLYGVICFETVESFHHWTTEDIHFAGEIADQTAQALLYQERYKTEMALMQSEQQLRELNATKDKFFSIIAHDLKSPFNSIIGLSEILTSTQYNFSPEKTTLMIQKIHEASKATYELLNNLLTWARAQSENMVIDMEPIRLRQALAECVPLLEQQAQAKDIKITLDVSFEVLVSADKNLLYTILRNLINNAIKFTKSGGEIKIHSSENKYEVVIAISDNGVGIPEEYMDNLFKIESKHSTPGTENEKGTGLGLILCKSFVEKMGGTIWATSKPDIGSTFYFTLSTP